MWCTHSSWFLLIEHFWSETLPIKVFVYYFGSSVKNPNECHTTLCILPNKWKVIPLRHVGSFLPLIIPAPSFPLTKSRREPLTSFENCAGCQIRSQMPCDIFFRTLPMSDTICHCEGQTGLLLPSQGRTMQQVIRPGHMESSESERETELLMMAARYFTGHVVWLFALPHNENITRMCSDKNYNLSTCWVPKSTLTKD